MPTFTYAMIVLVVLGSSACNGDRSSDFSAASAYNVNSDPIVNVMAESEKTPQGTQELRQKLTIAASKPASYLVDKIRQLPFGPAIFSDHFISKYKNTLATVSIAGLYNVNPNHIIFTKNGRSDFIRLAVRFDTKELPQPDTHLQLLDFQAPGVSSDCNKIQKDWEDSSGITKQVEILDGTCNFSCAYASTFAGQIGGINTQMGGPASGGALKAAAVQGKFLVMMKANHCGASDSNCFSTSSGQLGGVTGDDCNGNVTTHKNKRICARLGSQGSIYHSVNSENKSLYCRCNGDKCAPGT